MTTLQCLSRLLVVLALFAAPNSAPALEYAATLLQPSVGYFTTAATGVSGTVQVGEGLGSATGGNIHALLWNSTAASIVDLHPAGALQSSAHGNDGNTQVGAGSIIAQNLSPHALMWHGTAASMIDLHPAGFNTSTADAVSGNSQVGSALLTVSPSDSRAMLWQGTAASAVNLHPAGFDSSAALGVDGNTQVGFAMTVDNLNNAVSRAIMWQGTAASFVNIHPASGYKQSRLEDVSGSMQVGSAYTDVAVSQQHAMLWKGTAASFVDLHPTGFIQSNALAIAGDLEVGLGLPTGSTNNHALVWNGTAGSVVDLHSTLAGMSINFVSSEAFDVDANGSIVGIARDMNQNRYAILWSPVVPEPSTGVMVACGLTGAGRLARRSRLR